MKATLRKFWELSWSDLCNLKAWMKRSASFNGFDVEQFQSNATLRIASATNERNEVVCYTPVETCFVVSAFAVSPNATPSEARAAGDLIDSEIAHYAQRAGVSKLLLIVPKDHPALQDNEWSDFKEVRVFERKIPSTINSGGVGCHKPTSVPASRYLN
jgi:hypothetical protein